MMVISRLVVGIVLLIFGVAALGSAYDIKSDGQAQFSNLQCNNILAAIEEDFYSPPEAQACAILQSTTTCVFIGELVGGMMIIPGIILVALSFLRSRGMKSQIAQPNY